MAEPVFIGSFPPWAANSTKTLQLVGSLPPGHELRQLQVVFEFTIISNVAGAGAVVAADHKTLQDAFISKLRMSFYGQNDVYNLTGDEARAIATYATGRDPATQFLRVGDTIPGNAGTALPTKVKFVIPFTHRGLEYPEAFAPSCDQGNLPNSKIDLDTPATNSLLATLTVGGVVVNIVISDVKLFAVVAPVVVSHAGPLMFWRSRSIVQSIDTETGMGLDLFFADERLSGPTTVAGTLEIQVQSVSVIRDNRMSPRNISPTNLAQHFAETQGPMDGNLPNDITRRLGGVAAQFACTPIIWVGGDIRASEWQWPMWVLNRQYQQNLASGGSASATLLFWQVRPITEVQQQLVQLSNQFQLGLTSLDQLGTRGGGGADNDTNKLFKGRYLQAQR